MPIRGVTAFIGLVAVSLTACSGPLPEDGATATATASSAGEPTEGGTLVAAIDSDPGSLNPAITTSGGTHTASELVFNGLVELTAELEPVPELAKSWEVLGTCHGQPPRPRGDAWQSATTSAPDGPPDRAQAIASGLVDRSAG